MTPAVLAGVDRIGALLAARVEANERFFAGEADRLARLCHAMAERFARGGRLLAFGANAVDSSDARHVAVEFVHPVIVGKRALPALALPPGEVTLLAHPDDIAIAFGEGPAVEAAVRDAGGVGTGTVRRTPRRRRVRAPGHRRQARTARARPDGRIGPGGG